MRAFSFLALSPLVVLLGCASSPPPVVKRGDIPTGSELAIVPFRDCQIADQDDCRGSGNIASTIFAQVLSSTPRFRVALLSRPVASDAVLTDDAAIALAKARGHQYVVNGEVDEYYDVASFTFRVDRAGVSVRVLRVSDGQVVATFSQRTKAGSNLSSPSELLKGMAVHVRDGL
jgi:hypothetical protein